MKLSNWDEAKMVAKALRDFLSKHCPSCGNRHSAACVDGGRCTRKGTDGLFCGRALPAITTLADAVNETKLLD